MAAACCERQENRFSLVDLDVAYDGLDQGAEIVDLVVSTGIVERWDGQSDFRFIHRSFVEHLAAYHVVGAWRQDPNAAVAFGPTRGSTKRLLEGIACLDPDEGLSPGQAQELTRVHDAYPHLHDDAFVAQHRERWLA